MGKFKVNIKTGILFCIVLLDFVSGLPHFDLNERVDEVLEKSGSDDSSGSSKDISLLLNRIRREIPDDSEKFYEGESSDDENDGPIQSRLGHHGHSHKSKRKGRNHLYLVFQEGVDYHSLHPLNHEQLPSIGSESWRHDPVYHGTPGFELWNRGNGNKFGHVHNHDFLYISGQLHNHDCVPFHNGGHDHEQGHHYGYDNHPWKKPVFDKFPSNKSPSDFEGGRPSENGPSDGAVGVDKTSSTIQKTSTTLPKIDIRAGKDKQ